MLGGLTRSLARLRWPTPRTRVEQQAGVERLLAAAVLSRAAPTPTSTSPRRHLHQSGTGWAGPAARSGLRGAGPPSGPGDGAPAPASHHPAATRRGGGVVAAALASTSTSRRRLHHHPGTRRGGVVAAASASTSSARRHLHHHPTGTRRGVAASATTDQAPTTSPSLPYPRAAVAAVALRPTPTGPQALVVRRSRPPHAGCWSFPGGSLELGEGVVAGAARELFEECGVGFKPGSTNGGSSSSSSSLAATGPTPFTASDAIDRDPSTGALRFHYAIVQVAGLVDEGAQPVAGDDAAAVGWVDLAALAGGRPGCAPEGGGGEFTPGCVAVAREALGRFGVELGALSSY